MLESESSLRSPSVRDIRLVPHSPSGEPIYTTLSRTKKRPAVAVWSRCYRCACTLAALMVGASPLGIISMLSLFQTQVDTMDGELSAPAAASNSKVPKPSNRCPLPPGQMPRVNATVTSSRGRQLAVALLVDEGPRGEFRRAGRGVLTSTRAHALSNGLLLFGFEPCSLPIGVIGLLAAQSAVEACRLARIVVAHRCPPLSSPPPSANARTHERRWARRR